MEDKIMEQILLEWIIFKETHKNVWGEKRGNKFVMGTTEDGAIKEISLEESE